MVSARFVLIVVVFRKYRVFSEKLKSMEFEMQFFQNNPSVAIGFAAFVAGVGLMYLVMRRTHERRRDAD